MSQELLYTSAPHGLKPGSRGFCTVLSTQGMAAPLASALEGLSGYRPVYPPGDERTDLNPVNWSHVTLPVAGRTWHILSRVAEYGLDYSQRTNKLAHHVVLDSAELIAAGPAALLANPGFMRAEWNEEPHLAPPKPVHKIPPLPRGVCQAWKELTGDGGWAGVLAESFLRDPERPVILLYAPGQNMLPLIAEAISLIPADRRWDVTFSTYFTGLPQSVNCNWRCMLSGSPEAHQSLRFVRALRLDLTNPDALGIPAGNELVADARGMPRLKTGLQGKLPPLPTAIEAETGEDRQESASNIDDQLDQTPPLPGSNIYQTRPSVPPTSKRQLRNQKVMSDDADEVGWRKKKTILIGLLGIALLLLVSLGIGIGRSFRNRPALTLSQNQSLRPSLPRNPREVGGRHESAIGTKNHKEVRDNRPVTSPNAPVPKPIVQSADAGKQITPTNNPIAKAAAVAPAEIPTQQEAAVNTATPPVTTKIPDKKVALNLPGDNRTDLLTLPAGSSPVSAITLLVPKNIPLSGKKGKSAADGITFDIIEKQGIGAQLAVISANSNSQDKVQPAGHTLELKWLSKEIGKSNYLNWCELDVKYNSQDDFTTRIRFHPFPLSDVELKTEFKRVESRIFKARWKLGNDAFNGIFPEIQVKSFLLGFKDQTYEFLAALDESNSAPKENGERPAARRIVLKLNSSSQPEAKPFPPGLSLRFETSAGASEEPANSRVEMTLLLSGYAKLEDQFCNDCQEYLGAPNKHNVALQHLRQFTEFKTLKLDVKKPKNAVSMGSQISEMIDVLKQQKEILSQNKGGDERQKQESFRTLDAVANSLGALAKRGDALVKLEEDLAKCKVVSAAVFYSVSGPNQTERSVYIFNTIDR
ncbi:MAG: hypothetical protein JWN70_6854 [Planctomycetaceae bacterium]|nr:hypothetical protein [Planctomycetaceae bacterium]